MYLYSQSGCKTEVVCYNLDMWNINVVCMIENSCARNFVAEHIVIGIGMYSVYS